MKNYLSRVKKNTWVGLNICAGILYFPIPEFKNELAQLFTAGFVLGTTLVLFTIPCLVFGIVKSFFN